MLYQCGSTPLSRYLTSLRVSLPPFRTCRGQTSIQSKLGPNHTQDMDELKADIARKRKAREEAAAGRPMKYMKKGDLERIEQEKEAATRAELEAKRDEERHLKTQSVLRSRIPMCNVRLTPSRPLKSLQRLEPPRLETVQRQKPPASLTSRMTRLYVVYVQRVSPLDCSARQTKTDDYDYEHWNS
jgi:hypothetical protein